VADGDPGTAAGDPDYRLYEGRSPDDSKHLLAAFLQGLSETGFVEGKNVTIEYRWALTLAIMSDRF
jgi:hypothetical protein